MKLETIKLLEVFFLKKKLKCLKLKSESVQRKKYKGKIMYWWDVDKQRSLSWHIALCHTIPRMREGVIVPYRQNVV
jgi:hypothetical protein